MTTRVLVTSYVFPPSVGGIERASLMLARMLVDLGYETTVVTLTGEEWPAERDEAFAVVRRPNAGTLLRLVRGADAVIVNNVSLRLQWPLFLTRRPHLTVLHAALEQGTLRYRVVRRFKLFVLRRASSVVSVSHALARLTPVPSVVIPNTYDPGVFRTTGTVERPPGTVVFLGRLIRQKGADVLLDAVRLLRTEGVAVELTVIGDGPEHDDLAKQSRALGIADHVRFAGSLSGSALNDELQANVVMALPSRGHEPFAITVLEGLAAGCALVVTDTGGPPEALGPSGLVVPPEDARRLADAIERLLTDEALRTGFAQAGGAHLADHSPAAIGAQYDRLLTRALGTAHRRPRTRG